MHSSDSLHDAATWHRMVLLVLLLGVPFAVRILPADDAEAGRTGGWHIGRRLTQELARPVNIVLRRTTPRQVVLRLRQLHDIALLLDRRIDPDQTIEVQFTQQSLQEALETLAVQLDADLVQIGGTLLIGPPQGMDHIRTLIEVRTAELRGIDGEDAVGRQFELLRGTTFTWEDLTEPMRLFDDLCSAFELTSVGSSRVPHDLWAAGVMADVNAIEALSLLLGQFDQTFAWEQQAAALSLQPIPSSVSVQRDHTLRQRDAVEAIKQIGELFPYLEPEVAGRAIRLHATVGEHEAIADMLDPSRTAQVPPETKLGPLSRRRFTIKAMRAEAIAVLRTLETQEVTVEYDPDELRQAGVDLGQTVSLELKDATAEELFRQLCEPLGMTFEIDERTVRLKPVPP